MDAPQNWPALVSSSTVALACVGIAPSWRQRRRTVSWSVPSSAASDSGAEAASHASARSTSESSVCTELGILSRVSMPKRAKLARR